MNRSEADELINLVVKTQNRLRGRLLSLCESWDLGDDRTAAMKDIIKGVTYDNEFELKQTLHQHSKDAKE